MAGATDLKVRVGLLFDEKSLNNIERQLRNSGRRLSDIGTDLTLSLSAPLALFGAASIKAAGDIESLTLALKSQLGTADAAAAELDKLTDAAKNPGLGLEQAVRGSVRLQGVGFAAEEARETLVQMGNAIAATGGSAQELDNVTRQFAQMTSKGRVLQEDVSILSENMPGLAGLMQKAFGTQSVEAIRDMGISGKEFVKQITAAASELPRVEGGIKNGIGNAMDSLKQSAAKVGLAINEAFNVTGSIETLSSAVLFLAEGFASLDPTIQKVILGFAGMLIAIGPLIKVKGALMLVGSQLIGLWSGMVGFIKPVIAAFNALNLATRAFILVGVIAAVLLFVDAFQSYTSELTTAERAQASLLNVQKKAADSIAGQKSEVDTLVNAYKQEGVTLKQKAAILDRLNQISPEYYGAIKAGKGDVEALTVATAKYSAELLKVAQLTAYKERLVEIEKAQLDVSKTAEPSTLQTFGNFLLATGNIAKFATDQVGSYTSNVKAANESLVAEKDAILELVTKMTLADAATGSLANKTKGLGNGLNDASPKAKALAEALSDIANESARQDLLGLNDVDAKLSVAESALKRLLDAGWKPTSVEIKNVVDQVIALQVELNALTPPKPIIIDIVRRESSTGSSGPQPISDDRIKAVQDQVNKTRAIEEAYNDEWKAAREQVAREVTNATFDILGSGISRSAEQEKAALTEKANIQLELAEGNAERQAAIRAELDTKIAQIDKKEGRRKKALALSEAIVNTAVAITKAIASAPPPFNIPAIVAASVSGAAQIATISATPFAKGTQDAPGGVALVGEQGPELIHLPKHSKVFPTPKTNQMLSNMGGGGVTVGGEFTVRGTDLVLVLDRANQKNQRFR
jgi:tape measure domain-containing protein